MFRKPDGQNFTEVCHTQMGTSNDVHLDLSTSRPRLHTAVVALEGRDWEICLHPGQCWALQKGFVRLSHESLNRTSSLRFRHQKVEYLPEISHLGGRSRRIRV